MLKLLVYSVICILIGVLSITGGIGLNNYIANSKSGHRLILSFLNVLSMVIMILGMLLCLAGFTAFVVYSFRLFNEVLICS